MSMASPPALMLERFGGREKRLRIGFDMTFAGKSLTGTGVYAREVKKAIEATQDVEVIELASSSTVRPSGRGNVLTGARNLIWLQSGLRSRLEALQVDILHEPAFLGPLDAPCPVVVNVLDTIYLSYPADFDYKWRLYARLLIGRTVKRAAAIITLSEFSRNQIAKAYNVSEDRIHVVYPGIGGLYKPVVDPNALKELRAIYGLGDEYCLFVGAAERRKNLVALVEAFALLKSNGRFSSLRLVLVGPRGQDSPHIDSVIRHTGIHAAVVQLGYVSDQDLPGLYSGARLLAFPSKMEGFGLPLVEAMACGTPVVGVPCAPIPEVTGGSALLAESAEAGSLAFAMERVLADEDLSRSLRARGFERARYFSWDRAAQETIAVYEEMNSRGSPSAAAKTGDSWQH